VEKPEDVFDYMIENKIGTTYSRTFDSIARYFEFSLMDFKKSDKVYRIGLRSLKDSKELDNLRSLYSRFSLRMTFKLRQYIQPKLEKAD
jgi:hypothetical protein